MMMMVFNADLCHLLRQLMSADNNNNILTHSLNNYIAILIKFKIFETQFSIDTKLNPEMHSQLLCYLIFFY